MLRLTRVFDLLTDYERFFRPPGYACRLLAEGRDCRVGTGAVREVTTGGSVFSEEITAFDAPRHFEYVVRKLVNARGKPVRMLHDRGWLDVSAVGAETRVDWYSRFEITVPIVGWLIERVVGPRAAAAFLRLLERAKDDLEGQTTKHAVKAAGKGTLGAS